jgi:hypothetical protein
VAHNFPSGKPWSPYRPSTILVWPLWTGRYVTEVTIDEVWIGSWIYWTPWYTQLVTALHSSLSHIHWCPLYVTLLSLEIPWTTKSCISPVRTSLLTAKSSQVKLSLRPVSLASLASLSWSQATTWDPWPIFLSLSLEIIFRELRVCYYGASSLTRDRVSNLQLLLTLASAVFLGSEFRGTHNQFLWYQIWDSPNLEGQVPVFISPRNRVAQLYPQALAVWVPPREIASGRTTQKTHTLSLYPTAEFVCCRETCFFTGSCITACCTSVA